LPEKYENKTLRMERFMRSCVNTKVVCGSEVNLKNKNDGEKNRLVGAVEPTSVQTQVTQVLFALTLSPEERIFACRQSCDTLPPLRPHHKQFCSNIKSFKENFTNRKANPLL
jgi:hypothetical protein